MSILRVPGLGPIVGHTTAESCRIWIRGKDRSDSAGYHADDRRTIGLITVESVDREETPEDYQGVYCFRLHRKFDRTGTFNLGRERCLTGPSHTNLTPNTHYAVRVGTLTLDDSFASDQNISNEEVARSLPNPRHLRDDLIGLPRPGSSAEFRTFASESEGSLSFLLGSCRYPGMLSKAKEADEIFGPMLEQARGGNGREPVRMALMVGDQIYADKFNRNIPIGLADTFEEFQERYLTAFGTRNMAALLREIPTYMILDDHEIEDNWTQDRLRTPVKNRADARKMFNLAIAAYRSYQWVHGPRTYPNRLYYQFTCSGYPFFVLDTRTQRYMEDTPNDLRDNRLLGRSRHVSNEGESGAEEGEPSQVERLEYWLKFNQEHYGNAPKFLVSSSVFAPNPMDARTGRLNGDIQVEESREQMIKWMEASDSWPAFPETRRRLLCFIIANGIQNVVFLSGDIHCSNVAQIELSRNGNILPLKMASVTSSAFYWPFPFADGEPSDYVHDSQNPEQSDSFRISDTDKMDYKAYNFTQADNFCRIDIDRGNHRIVVTPFDKKGRQVCRTNWLGMYDTDQPLEGVINLEPW